MQMHSLHAIDACIPDVSPCHQTLSTDLSAPDIFCFVACTFLLRLLFFSAFPALTPSVAWDQHPDL